MEEVDQIETEPKSEEAKQVPKIPSGALQNGINSPDSGHPSSRNFSVTSGLSDGSLSTEDSAAPEPQSPAHTARGEREGPPEGKDGRVKNQEEQEEAPDGAQPAHTTKTEELVTVHTDTSTQPRTQETAEEPGAIQPERDRKDAPADRKGVSSGESQQEVPGEDAMTAAARGSKGEPGEQRLEQSVTASHEEASKREKSVETNIEEVDEMDGSKSKTPRGAALADRREHKTRGVAQSLVLSPASGVSAAREAFSPSPADEAQPTADSDESPSAIEMEDIPKAKVTMVPLSRKSSPEDSAPPTEQRESVLSEEPERPSPRRRSLAESGDANGAAGGPLSVRTCIYSLVFTCIHGRDEELHVSLPSFVLFVSERAFGLVYIKSAPHRKGRPALRPELLVLHRRQPGQAAQRHVQVRPDAPGR